MAVKLGEIASHLGLSISVVSRALSINPDKYAVVKKETAERVREYAREIGYQPNRQASFLSKGGSATIFCFLHDTPTRLANDLMLGIAEAASSQNFPINFFFGRNAKDFENFIMYSNRNEHSGLLSMPPPSMSDAIARKFSEYYANYGKALFINTISNTLDEGIMEKFSNVPHLNIDEFYGGQLAAEHLISCDCDSYYMVSHFINNVFSIREHGFCEQFAKRGVPFETVNINDLSSRTFDAGKRHGFFTDDDYLALDMYPLLAVKGLSLGNNAFLCGFDDIFYSRIAMPSLTTIHQPTRQEGRLAVAKLINMIFGRREVNQKVRPFLIRRESTGGQRPDPEKSEQEDIITQL